MGPLWGHYGATEAVATIKKIAKQSETKIQESRQKVKVYSKIKTADEIKRKGTEIKSASSQAEGRGFESRFPLQQKQGVRLPA